MVARRASASGSHKQASLYNPIKATGNITFASANPARIIAAWREFSGLVAELKLPFAPAAPIFYDERPDRPQPRLDIERGHGMTVSCGRLRPCSILDWKFTMLSHNTIRGAAGAALLNAELLKAKGYFE